jgi:hypothetical protein
MLRALPWAAVVVLLVAVNVPAQDTKYSVKSANMPPPKELDESIRKLLTPEAVQVVGPQGDVIAELWLRGEVPADATPEQVKNGVTYREIPQTTILGAVRFDKGWSDYRKQKVKAGIYTIRLGFQPQDGDHMGTAPYSEFGLLVAAGEDKSAATMEPKKLHELSATSIGTSHPAVMLFFPNAKPAAAPRVEVKNNNHVVLNARENVKTKETTGVLGLGLTLVGHSD